MSNVMMTDFEWCKYAYDRGWARVDQLRIWVQANKITAEQFKEITGQDY